VRLHVPFNLNTERTRIQYQPAVKDIPGESIQMKLILQTGEVEIGTWTLLYVPPVEN